MRSAARVGRWEEGNKVRVEGEKRVSGWVDATSAFGDEVEQASKVWWRDATRRVRLPGWQLHRQMALSRVGTRGITGDRLCRWGG